MSSPVPPNGDKVTLLGNLKVLVLFGNSLTGTIPTDYGKFERLQHVDLSHNQVRRGEREREGGWGREANGEKWEERSQRRETCGEWRETYGEWLNHSASGYGEWLNIWLF